MMAKHDNGISVPGRRRDDISKLNEGGTPGNHCNIIMQTVPYLIKSPYTAMRPWLSQCVTAILVTRRKQRRRYFVTADDPQSTFRAKHMREYIL